jgi:hypothetical protein
MIECNSENLSFTHTFLENFCQSYLVLGSKYENIVLRDSPTIILSYLFIYHSFYAGLRDIQNLSNRFGFAVLIYLKKLSSFLNIKNVTAETTSVIS